MLKRNKKIIKIILFSLAITGIIRGNVNASTFKNIETKSKLISTNVVQDEDQRRAKLVQEYQTNKFLKDFVDSVRNYEQNRANKSRDEQIAIILDISQKAQLAKNSNTLSKEALDFIDEIIQKDLEPNYTNFLNEAKNKGMKPAPVPEKQRDDMKPAPVPEKAKDGVKPTPKQKQEKAQDKKMQEKAKKHLPKTGNILDNNLLLQIGTSISLLGVYIAKKSNNKK